VPDLHELCFREDGFLVLGEPEQLLEDERLGLVRVYGHLD